MSKGTGVNASSFLDLKAELARQESDFRKTKAAGGPSYTVGGVKRPEKKPTVWARQNKGVQSRSERDLEQQLSKPTIESARAALERKAAIYDKLRRGKAGGLNEAQFDALLVDFDLKAVENGVSSESESESDVDESSTVPQRPQQDNDPMVEYTDEFGRVRTVRRSELPREVARPSLVADMPDMDDPYLVHGNANFFPTYKPSEERIAEIREKFAEDPITKHYDATQDVRAKGAGFYRFSGDEEERQRQMEELRSARDDTAQARAETGAVDRPEESTKSRAAEKRKRDIEERRRLVEAKRRKVAGLPPEDDKPSTTSVAADPTVQVDRARKEPQSSKMSAADDFLANLERDLLNR